MATFGRVATCGRDSLERYLITPLLWVMGISLVLIAGSAILAGLAIPAWQVFVWLRDGEWVPFSIIDSLRPISAFFSRFDSSWTAFDAWLATPASWIGVHKLLSFLHASVGCWAAAMAAALALQESGGEP